MRPQTYWTYISKLAENHLITKNTPNVYTIHQVTRTVVGLIWPTFNLTQLLFLADSDIVYGIVDVDIRRSNDGSLLSCDVVK